MITTSVLVIIPPTGTASAGLAAGFLHLAQFSPDSLCILAVSLCASLLRHEAWLTISCSYVLSTMLGCIVMIDIQAYPLIYIYMVGLLVTLCLSSVMLRSRGECIAFLVIASCGYHIGRINMLMLPELAHPLYFIIGQFIAMVLALSLCVTIFMVFMRQAYGRYAA